MQIGNAEFLEDYLKDNKELNDLLQALEDFQDYSEYNELCSHSFDVHIKKTLKIREEIRIVR